MTEEDDLNYNLDSISKNEVSYTKNNGFDDNDSFKFELNEEKLEISSNLDIEFQEKQIIEIDEKSIFIEKEEEFIFCKKEKKKNNIFNWKQYIENYPELYQNGIDSKEKAFKHWKNYGEREGRTYQILSLNKNNNFDWIQYIENYKDLQEKGINSYTKAKNHWNLLGKDEGRTFLKNNNIPKSNTTELKENFDWIEYIEFNKDLQKEGLNCFEKAWQHWLYHGKKENRIFPILDKYKKISFDWQSYIEFNNDLIEEGINNLDEAWNHWIKHGKQEGRIFPFIEKYNKKNFNWQLYIKKYPDLINNNINTLEKAWIHWISHGKHEGRIFYINNENDFNWKQYIKNYPDLIEKEINNFENSWEHWFLHGKREGRTDNNFHENEINDEYKDKCDIISYNSSNLKFKQKYDLYGTHYYGWKGVINNFINWYSKKSIDKKFIYKNNLFFDEWLEKLLIWGNKLLNENYLNCIKKNNDKIITFLHNPPFLQYNSINFKNRQNFEVLINNNYSFNENIIKILENLDLIENIQYIYVLSINHKNYLYNTYPKLQNKLVSVFHPIDLKIDNKYQFNFEDFLINKKIYNVGWWLRNFKTFIDFIPPINFEKCILVKNDFKNQFDDIIIPNNNLSSVTLIYELTNEEYCSLFKNCCIFADIIDCVANNTILECIKFNTPIIVRRSKSAEEYLGINYPLFFSDLEDLYYLQDEKFLIELINEANEYLLNLNKNHIELDTFNKKINYDLNKLIIKKEMDEFYLTWCCFIDNNINNIELDKIISNFIYQNSIDNIKLLLIININDVNKLDQFIIYIKKYLILYKNISYEILNENYISLNNQIYYSVQYSNTAYITIINKNINYNKQFSQLGIQKLDNQDNIDIIMTSFNKIDKNNNVIENNIFQNNILFDLNFVENYIIDNKGLIWRKEIYNLIESNSNNNFWLKCVENNLNIIGFSENPLFSIIEN